MVTLILLIHIKLVVAMLIITLYCNLTINIIVIESVVNKV